MDPISARFAQLDECTTWHSGQLKRRLAGLRKQPNSAGRFAQYQEEFDQLIAESKAIVSARAAARPTITYPEQLPVVQQRDELADAIAHHQVVIIAGETGSGKTTQLPKICLELGRGVRGLIGHTQPRRLAARSVSARIAEELGQPLGESVGYKVRFDEQFTRDGYIKLMTDGILLNEIQQDPWLNEYDTLIIDEAHERSLNIDFILGYLKQLLPRRPDLKVIITSATIDPERFSKHFDNAPIFEVSGRTYPVEMRYRPLVSEDKEVTRDLEQGILDAIAELMHEGGTGDILIFMNGEREIRDLAQTLNRQQYRDTEILPLYARLASHEQQRVFRSHSGRRIVIATNVAETSLTVPGIRYVIDPGTARLSRYSARAKIQRLPIEPISQASARQRAGRCGRVAAGICIRLYSEEDFENRPAFTDPEILRTNLASVILQMAALGLGDIEAFPFVEPPDTRTIADGIRLLEELGAVTSSKRRVKLTALGRDLSRLPIDPRMARMLLAAREKGCLEEVTVIVSALSIQDPRERPLEKQQAADQAHAAWRDKDSDFNAFVNLWQGLREARSERSGNQFRNWCRDHFINYLRVREWQDLYSQLRGQMRELNGRYNREPGDYTSVHQALATGLLSQIGMLGKPHEYLGSRNTKFWIFPGSGVKKSPKWIMSAELTETSRLFARNVARIDPAWLEHLAQHLVKRSHAEPHFSKKRQEVVAKETQMLFGLPIVSQRPVSYGRINATEATELFIREALVERQLVSRQKWWQRNLQVLNGIEEKEARLRRRDLLIDDEKLFNWYQQRLPAHIYSRNTLESWCKKHPEQAQALAFTEQDVLASVATEEELAQYPRVWKVGDLDLKLHYQFDPGSERDGVMVDVPLALLNQLDEAEFAWQVPGMREELVITMIRSLPKSLRRQFVPAPDVAKRVVASVNPEQGTLLQEVTRALQKIAGQPLDAEQLWQGLQLPEHLRLKYRLLDEKGNELAINPSLDALRKSYQQRVEQLVEASVDNDLPVWESTGEWCFGELPESLVREQPGYQLTLYPALRDERDHVVLEYSDSAGEARQIHHRGVRRLLLLSIPSPRKHLESRLPNKAKLTMYYNPLGSVAELLDDLINAATDAVLPELEAIRDESAFTAARDQLRAELNDKAERMARYVEQILLRAHELRRKLKGKVPFDQVLQYADVRQQLEQLVYAGFICDTTEARLADLQRYLDALVKRLEKLAIDPHKDRRLMQIVQDLEQRYQQLAERPLLQKNAAAELREAYWQLQELRVSYFAQQLGTNGPVSDKRIKQTLDALAAQAQ